VSEFAVYCLITEASYPVGHFMTSLFRAGKYKHINSSENIIIIIIIIMFLKV